MHAREVRGSSLQAERDNVVPPAQLSVAQPAQPLQLGRAQEPSRCPVDSHSKTETPKTRPCGVIAPERAQRPPPQTPNVQAPLRESWHIPDHSYNYGISQNSAEYVYPQGNISPRQTFQENMRRIHVPPRCDLSKINLETSAPVNYPYQSKNAQGSIHADTKYCQVPYLSSQIPKQQRTSVVRNNEMYTPSVGGAALHGRGWHVPAASVTAPHLPAYYPPDYYNLQQPCTPTDARTNKMALKKSADDISMYGDSLYRGGDIRFDPYPLAKDKHSRFRYSEYINYPNSYHTQKIDSTKPVAAPVYVNYTPQKYVDPRIAEPRLSDSHSELYVRPTQYVPGFSAPHAGDYSKYIQSPSYCLPNKLYSYPESGLHAAAALPKGPYELNKSYYDHDYGRGKQMGDNPYMTDVHPYGPKKQLPLNYPSNNSQPRGNYLYHHQNENTIKGYLENAPKYHYSDVRPSIHNPLAQIPTQFSPNIISPSESNASIDSVQAHGTLFEDCGYVSQCSTTSAKSVDYSQYKVHHYDNSVHDSRMYHMRPANLQKGSKISKGIKDDKNLDVRQFLQNWDEDDEDDSTKTKENISQPVVKPVASATIENPEKPSGKDQPLYVLGYVNIPSEEIDKYEHIQKVYKLPENIRGYDSADLLNKFDEAFRPCASNSSAEQATSHTQPSLKPSVETPNVGFVRSPSPFDIEAKITQSVIHKDVGCNFEIKPFSPPPQNVDAISTIPNPSERKIEKIINQNIEQPTIPAGFQDVGNNIKCAMKRRSVSEEETINNKLMKSTITVCSLDSNVNKHDLIGKDFNTVSDLCLASLPRLDNEMEINFPEINEQYSGLKGIQESVIMNMSYNSTVPLGAKEISTNKHKVKQSDFKLIHESEIESCLYECSKTVPGEVHDEKYRTKLTKYRKSRSAMPSEYNGDSLIQPAHVKSSHQDLSVQRTNSVIIKNPDSAETTLSYDESTLSRCVKEPLSSTGKKHSEIKPDWESENELNYLHNFENKKDGDEYEMFSLTTSKSPINLIMHSHTEEYTNCIRPSLIHSIENNSENTKENSNSDIQPNCDLAINLSIHCNEIPDCELSKGIVKNETVTSEMLQLNNHVFSESDCSPKKVDKMISNEAPLANRTSIITNVSLNKCVDDENVYTTKLIQSGDCDNKTLSAHDIFDEELLESNDATPSIDKIENPYREVKSLMDINSPKQTDTIPEKNCNINSARQTDATTENPVIAPTVEVVRNTVQNEKIESTMKLDIVDTDEQLEENIENIALHIMATGSTSYNSNSEIKKKGFYHNNNISQDNDNSIDSENVNGNKTVEECDDVTNFQAKIVERNDSSHVEDTRFVDAEAVRKKDEDNNSKEPGKIQIETPSCLQSINIQYKDDGDDYSDEATDKLDTDRTIKYNHKALRGTIFKNNDKSDINQNGTELISNNDINKPSLPIDTNTISQLYRPQNFKNYDTTPIVDSNKYVIYENSQRPRAEAPSNECIASKEGSYRETFAKNCVLPHDDINSSNNSKLDHVLVHNHLNIYDETIKTNKFIESQYEPDLVEGTKFTQICNNTNFTEIGNNKSNKTNILEINDSCKHHNNSEIKIPIKITDRTPPTSTTTYESGIFECCKEYLILQNVSEISVGTKEIFTTPKCSQLSLEGKCLEKKLGFEIETHLSAKGNDETLEEIDLSSSDNLKNTPLNEINVGLNHTECMTGKLHLGNVNELEHSDSIITGSEKTTEHIKEYNNESSSKISLESSVETDILNSICGAVPKDVDKTTMKTDVIDLIKNSTSTTFSSNNVIDLNVVHLQNGNESRMDINTADMGDESPYEARTHNFDLKTGNNRNDSYIVKTCGKKNPLEEINNTNQTEVESLPSELKIHASCKSEKDILIESDSTEICHIATEINSGMFNDENSIKYANNQSENDLQNEFVIAAQFHAVGPTEINTGEIENGNSPELKHNNNSGNKVNVSFESDTAPEIPAVITEPIDNSTAEHESGSFEQGRIVNVTTTEIDVAVKVKMESDTGERENKGSEFELRDIKSDKIVNSLTEPDVPADTDIVKQVSINEHENKNSSKLEFENTSTKLYNSSKLDIVPKIEDAVTGHVKDNSDESKNNSLYKCELGTKIINDILTDSDIATETDFVVTGNIEMDIEERRNKSSPEFLAVTGQTEAYIGEHENEISEVVLENISDKVDDSLTESDIAADTDIQTEVNTNEHENESSFKAALEATIKKVRNISTELYTGTANDVAVTDIVMNIDEHEKENSYELKLGGKISNDKIIMNDSILATEIHVRTTSQTDINIEDCKNETSSEFEQEHINGEIENISTKFDIPAEVDVALTDLTEINTVVAENESPSNYGGEIQNNNSVNIYNITEDFIEHEKIYISKHENKILSKSTFAVSSDQGQTELNTDDCEKESSFEFELDICHSKKDNEFLVDFKMDTGFHGAVRDQDVINDGKLECKRLSEPLVIENECSRKSLIVNRLGIFTAETELLSKESEDSHPFGSNKEHKIGITDNIEMAENYVSSKLEILPVNRVISETEIENDIVTKKLSVNSDEKYQADVEFISESNITYIDVKKTTKKRKINYDGSADMDIDAEPGSKHITEKIVFNSENIEGLECVDNNTYSKGVAYKGENKTEIVAQNSKVNPEGELEYNLNESEFSDNSEHESSTDKVQKKASTPIEKDLTKHKGDIIFDTSVKNYCIESDKFINKQMAIIKNKNRQSRWDRKYSIFRGNVINHLPSFVQCDDILECRNNDNTYNEILGQNECNVQSSSDASNSENTDLSGQVSFVFENLSKKRRLADRNLNTRKLYVDSQDSSIIPKKDHTSNVYNSFGSIKDPIFAEAVTVSKVGKLFLCDNETAIVQNPLLEYRKDNTERNIDSDMYVSKWSNVDYGTENIDGRQNSQKQATRIQKDIDKGDKTVNTSPNSSIAATDIFADDTRKDACHFHDDNSIDIFQGISMVPNTFNKSFLYDDFWTEREVSFVPLKDECLSMNAPSADNTQSNEILSQGNKNLKSIADPAQDLAKDKPNSIEYSDSNLIAKANSEIDQKSHQTDVNSNVGDIVVISVNNKMEMKDNSNLLHESSQNKKLNCSEPQRYCVPIENIVCMEPDSTQECSINADANLKFTMDSEGTKHTNELKKSDNNPNISSEHVTIDLNKNIGDGTGQINEEIILLEECDSSQTSDIDNTSSVNFITHNQIHSTVSDSLVSVNDLDETAEQHHYLILENGCIGTDSNTLAINASEINGCHPENNFSNDDAETNNLQVVHSPTSPNSDHEEFSSLVAVENCENVTKIGCKELWIDDIACVETVVSEDVIENTSDEYGEEMADKETDANCNVNYETPKYDLNFDSMKIKNIYGDNINMSDIHLIETLYRTPHMNVGNKLLKENNSNNSRRASFDKDTIVDYEGRAENIKNNYLQSACTVYTSVGLEEQNTQKNLEVNKLAFVRTERLITKAAQKYVPPLKVSAHDLKVKLLLPIEMLENLKRLKLLRQKQRSPIPKLKISTSVLQRVNPNSKKKFKPNFEDVLKHIDDAQYKLNVKSRYKKNIKGVPKVIIKKNLNGSHYTSKRVNSSVNPDLTGSKWQPWVRLERLPNIERFIPKQKIRVTFCHLTQKYKIERESKTRFKRLYSVEGSDQKPLKCTISLNP